MAVAAADGQVTTEELNLLKDFTFEYSLTEQEWAEIQYYARAHLSKNELEQLIETVASEIRGRSDREQFERAIREMMEADSILGGGEDKIADILYADVKRVHASRAAYIYKTLRVAWRKRLQLPEALASLEDEAKEYGRNPVAALLLRHPGSLRQLRGCLETAGPLRPACINCVAMIPGVLRAPGLRDANGPAHSRSRGRAPGTGVSPPISVKQSPTRCRAA